MLLRIVANAMYDITISIIKMLIVKWGAKRRGKHILYLACAYLNTRKDVKLQSSRICCYPLRQKVLLAIVSFGLNMSHGNVIGGSVPSDKVILTVIDNR